MSTDREASPKTLKGIEKLLEDARRLFTETMGDLEANPLDLKWGETCNASMSIQDGIECALNSINYDSSEWFIKDFEESTSKRAAAHVAESWADCMYYSVCHDTLASIPWIMPPEKILRQMGLGQSSFLNRFGPNAYRTSMELFQINRFLQSGYDRDFPKKESRWGYVRALPEKAVAILGTELSNLATRFCRTSRKFCSFVETFSSQRNRGPEMKDSALGALLCLHELMMHGARSEALWCGKIHELEAQKHGD